jgi:hypothetical protein
MTACPGRGKTGVMASDAPLVRRTWRPWTVQLPAALATAVCIFLGTIGWLFVEMIGGYNCALTDGPAPPGCSGTDWWLVAGGLGQWVLAAAVITAGIRSRSRPGSRPAGAIACWLAIPLAIGWFALCLTSSQL